MAVKPSWGEAYTRPGADEDELVLLARLVRERARHSWTRVTLFVVPGDRAQWEEARRRREGR
jgi:hypothetical protein